MMGSASQDDTFCSDSPCSLPHPVVHHTRHDGHETTTMPPFDDWNVIDDEEEEELQDTSVSLHDLVCFTE